MLDRWDATLIFPCCVPEGVDYARDARQRGERVVAASSLAYDPTADRFETWLKLPSVYDGDFAQRLDEAVTTYAIARIFCSVPAAHVALTRLANEGKLSIPIIGEASVQRHLREHRALMTRAEAEHSFIRALTEGR